MNGQAPQTAGAWLAGAALLLTAALALHPPPPGETEAFMNLIAAEGQTWVIAHWLAAAALAAFVVAGLVATTALARGPLTQSAWAVLAVGAGSTAVTAVAEATAVSEVAAAGDLAAYSAWEGLAAGLSMGFALLALAVAGIAFDEARSRTSQVPRWSGYAASAVALLASVAWILNAAFGVSAGGPVWLVGSLVMNAWLLWFGVALARRPAAQVRREAVHA